MQQTKRVQLNVAFVTLLRGGKVGKMVSFKSVVVAEKGARMKQTVSILSAMLLVLTATFVRAAATISYSGAFLNNTGWRETDVAKTSSVDADGDNVIGDDGYLFLNSSGAWVHAYPAALSVATPSSGYYFGLLSRICG
jgi:hypothetical protein